VQSGSDAISILISAPTFLMVHVYSLHFVTYEIKIKNFLKEMQEIGDEDSSAKPFMETAYKNTAKHNLYAVSLLLIPGIIITSLFPIITGKTTLVLWQPKYFMSGEESFILMHLYQMLLFAHTGSLFVNFLELFVHPLAIINGFSKYCDYYLSKLSHQKKLSSTSIRDCVKVHQKLIYLQKKYNEVFAIPLVLQAFLSAYTNCALIFLFTSKVNQ
jgi:hypothetical protein